MLDVSLIVGGMRYGGWKTIKISRSIETAANEFSLSLSDVWTPGAKAWPIREGNQCVLAVRGKPIITGRVDSRNVSISDTSHTVTVEGRDNAAKLIDCSVNLGKWEFRKVPTILLLNQLSAQFGVAVTLAPGVTLPIIPEDVVSITPGDTAFSLLDRICKFAGVIPVSDGLGNLKLTQVQNIPSGIALIEGYSVKSGSASFDIRDRFHEYVVLGQQTNGGKSVKASYRDHGVDDVSRVLVIQAETATTQEKALTRAKWEATVRAAKSERVTVQVQGWEYLPGMLWEPGKIVMCDLPSLGVSGQMAIASADLSFDGGTTTDLTMVRPDAYSPELQSERTWKE